MTKSSLCLCLMLAFLKGGEHQDQTLYGVKDKVALVDTKNFNSVILGKENAWLIQFYRPSCGHCIGMAPWWKIMANAVKEWANVIALAVMDCEDKQNHEICMKYDFVTSPLLKFFPPLQKLGDLGEPWAGDRAIDLVTNKMLEMAYNYSKNAPPTWPDMEPARYPDINGLWAATMSGLSWVAVIVEDSGSHLGLDIILTAQHLRPYIRMTRAVKGQAGFVSSVKEEKTPYMIVVQRSGNSNTFRGPGAVQMREPYIRHLEEIAEKHYNWKNESSQRDVIDRNLTESRAQKEKERENAFGNGTIPTQVRGYPLHTVFTQDLDNAIREILWKEVGMHKIYTDFMKTTVYTNVRLMNKYLPVSEAAKSFLHSVGSFINKRKTLRNIALISNLQDFAKYSKFEKEVGHYIGCQGSKRIYRRHPCSMWVMYHTLTVNAYLKNKDDPKWNKQEVLVAMKNYITTFFSCKVCGKNFAKEAAKMTTSVKTVGDSVLWLWETHNSVNKRLKGKRAEDPLHPKIQFPPESVCKSCRISTNGDQITWNHAEVLKYLIEMYSTKIVSKTITPADMVQIGKNRREIRFNLIELDTPNSLTIKTSSDYSESLDHLQNIQATLYFVLFVVFFGLVIVSYRFIFAKPRSSLEP